MQTIDHSLDLILDTAPGLRELMDDRSVEEIIVNADCSVYVARCGGGRGRLRDGSHGFTPSTLKRTVMNIAAGAGKVFDEQHPILDAPLEDGSRAAAIMAPVSVGGLMLTIRKFPKRFSLTELVEHEMLSQDLAAWLVRGSLNGLNGLIAGSTGSGKTVLLNAVLAELPAWLRIGVIEDTPEIHLTKPNTFRLQPTVHSPQMSSLVRASLRQSADVLVIGEIRGVEAFDLMDVLNTGHNGSLSTIHASSARHALTRLATLIARANTGLEHTEIGDLISSAINYVCFLKPGSTGVRTVHDVVIVEPYDREKHQFRTSIRIGA